MSIQVPKVVITGASSGIGATYADRFARRGHDLALVARDETRMRALARRLEQEARVAIEVLKAGLTSPADLARVESLLREDQRIGVLVNDAGMAAHGSFANPDPDGFEQLLRLTVTALTRLVAAVLPRILRQGGGSAARRDRHGDLGAVWPRRQQVGCGDGGQRVVDAALVGFDRREAVTLPSLPNVDEWHAFDAARRAMLPNFGNAHAA
jgi:short-subunit dehydrogenase